MKDSFVLTLACPNRAGIVARVATLLFEAGFNILESQQYDDVMADRFFMRVVFDVVKGTADLERLKAFFAPLAADFSMTWALRPAGGPRRVLIFASKAHHCLADLLYRRRIGDINMTIAGLVTNHPPETYDGLDLKDVPIHYLPVTAETKLEQEQAVWRVIQESACDLVVLARYMQVLSDGLSAKLRGRCINIHHSFLPSFKGAKPYHQAHARGVKLIGATAHYVTSDLDEGPIIDQDVERVTHADTPETLIAKGRDIERRVLARAVKLHLDDRVMLNGRTTVVFA